MARKINALIVDDSDITRKMLMKALDMTELADFSYTEAADGAEALDVYAPENIDIMFVDLNMSGMDGGEFLRAAGAKSEKHTPAILVTAEADMEHVARIIREAHADGIMYKPFDPPRLKAGLKSIIKTIPTKVGPSVVPNGECAVNALKEVLFETCQLELTERDPEEELRTSNVVVGSIVLHGDVQWIVVFGFAFDTAKKVASKFTGFDIDNDEDLGDAIGELTNILAGRTQLLLDQQGLKTNLTLPSVYSVQNLRVLVQRKNTHDYFHFDSQLGKLWAGVTVGTSQGLIL